MHESTALEVSPLAADAGRTGHHDSQIKTHLPMGVANNDYWCMNVCDIALLLEKLLAFASKLDNLVLCQDFAVR